MPVEPPEFAQPEQPFDGNHSEREERGVETGDVVPRAPRRRGLWRASPRQPAVSVRPAGAVSLAIRPTAGLD
jgi:hypothetical protein